LEDQTFYHPLVKIAVMKVYRDAAELPADRPTVLGMAASCAIEKESAGEKNSNDFFRGEGVGSA